MRYLVSVAVLAAAMLTTGCMQEELDSCQAELTGQGAALKACQEQAQEDAQARDEMLEMAFEGHSELELRLEECLGEAEGQKRTLQAQVQELQQHVQQRQEQVVALEQEREQLAAQAGQAQEQLGQAQRRMDIATEQIKSLQQANEELEGRIRELEQQVEALKQQ